MLLPSVSLMLLRLNCGDSPLKILFYSRVPSGANLLCFVSSAICFALLCFCFVLSGMLECLRWLIQRRGEQLRWQNNGWKLDKEDLILEWDATTSLHLSLLSLFNILLSLCLMGWFAAIFVVFIFIDFPSDFRIDKISTYNLPFSTTYLN